MIKNFEEFKSKVICSKCDWSWQIESEDERPYFCHKCGYDNKLKEYDIPALKKWQIENDFPFSESIKDGYIIREFKNDIDQDLLVWHRDYENRVIEPIGKTNWKIQFENKLPVEINKQIEIPKGTYHRVIKGDGSLKIKLIKK